MKKRVVLFAMITVLGCRGFCTEEKDGIYYANLVACADVYKTKTNTVFVLSELDMYTAIGFGGGHGPGGSAAMQYVVLRSCKDWLLESAGTFVYSEPPKTEGEKLWIDRLSISPQDTQGLLGLLSHTNAAVRFIGLEKARRLSKFPPVIEEALRKIVQADPWVQYYDRSNDNPDDPYKDFHADLRDLASEVLADKCIQVSVNRKDVAKKGVDYIAWYSKKHDRQSVVFLVEFYMDSRSEGYRVLSEYAGNDPAILELQKVMKAAFLRRGGKNIKRSVLRAERFDGKIVGGTNVQSETINRKRPQL